MIFFYYPFDENKEMKVTLKKGAFFVGVYSHYEVYSGAETIVTLHYYDLPDIHIDYTIDKETSVRKNRVAVSERIVKSVEVFDEVGGERYSDHKLLEKQTYWPIDVERKINQAGLKKFLKKIDEKEPYLLDVKEAIEKGYHSAMDKFIVDKELFFNHDDDVKYFYNWFFIAVTNNRTRIVEWLLENPDFCKLEDENIKAEVLYAACEKGNLKIIQLLIENGYDINKKYHYKSDSIGDDPIAVLAKRTQKEAILWFLEKKIVVMSPKRFQSVFLELSNEVLFESLLKFIPAGSEEEYMNHALLGTANGYFGLIEKILDLGADINYMDESQMTAVCGALRTYSSTILKHLVEAGADVTLGDMGDGKNPIEYAKEMTMQTDYLGILQAKNEDDE